MKSFKATVSGCLLVYVMCLPSSSQLCSPGLIHARGLFVFGKSLDSFRVMDHSSLVPSSVLFPGFPVSSIFGGETPLLAAVIFFSAFTFYHPCPTSPPPSPSPSTSLGEDSDTDTPASKIPILIEEN